MLNVSFFFFSCVLLRLENPQVVERASRPLVGISEDKFLNLRFTIADLGNGV
jgi:hypothetical protein